MKHGQAKLLHSILISALVFALLLSAVVVLLNRVQTTSDEEQLQIVSNAVHQALMTCYAVEGAYPAELEYLEAHYGLTWDHERIYVFYDAFASNIMPSVDVRQREAEAE